LFIEDLIDSIASTVTGDKSNQRCEKIVLQVRNRPETFYKLKPDLQVRMAATAQAQLFARSGAATKTVTVPPGD